MSKFKVRFIPQVDLTVTVEAEDVDEAIDKAYQAKPSGICAHCSGGWGKPYSLDIEMFDGVEPYEVEDENGERVWSEPTHVDMLQRQIESLRRALAAAGQPS
jgi:hypothetical protein